MYTFAVPATIEIPQEFGGSWDAFCLKWCPEGSFGYSAAEVSKGLTTLKRLWPERLAENVLNASGGAWVPAISTESGLLLAANEKAKFFQGVLDRWKSGQRSAHAELVVGSALRTSGYDPRFEAGEGEPDLLCEVEGVPIAFEVYAPEDSQASQAQLALVDLLTEAVKKVVSNSRVEVGILDAFNASDIPSAVQAIVDAPPSKWVGYSSSVQFRRIDEGLSLPPTFDGDGAQVSSAGDTDVKGPGESVVVRWERLDTRARLSLERKRAQVRTDTRNIVVMDVCAVGGIGEWPETIALLPGGDFEKIGAVLFFDQGSVGPPEKVSRRWRIVVNPAAAFAIPESLLSTIESLDESSRFGLNSKPRLSMA